MESQLIFVVTVVFWPFALTKNPADVVNTTLGLIQGSRKIIHGRALDVYYGVPFALPPIDDLRFKRPKPAKHWMHIKHTNVKPNACWQTPDESFNRMPGVSMWNPNTNMSEDCLYLNCWVPRGFQSPIRATMVWIYGGSFSSGSSMLDVYDGSNLAAKENVIVFSFNYRLGPLGFLYTDIADAPGNQGLLDQVLALKWINENVRNFGGSLDTITIFGESAGAASIGFHLLSSTSMNYFTRAIMQSASPLVDWGIVSKSTAMLRTKAFANRLNCPINGTQGMLECLKKLEPQTLADKQYAENAYYFSVEFAPVVDGYFLQDNPRNLMRRGLIKDTQLIVGVNKDEGMYWLLYAFPEMFPLDNHGVLNKSDFWKILHQITYHANENVKKAILYLYKDAILNSRSFTYRNISDDVSGDQLFKCPVIDFAAQYTALRPSHDVYLFSYEHQLSNYPWPKWTGVMHGYEIETVFNLPMTYENYTNEDIDVTERMTSYWTRFAQSGSVHFYFSIFFSNTRYATHPMTKKYANLMAVFFA